MGIIQSIRQTGTIHGPGIIEQGDDCIGCPAQLGGVINFDLALQLVEIQPLQVLQAQLTQICWSVSTRLQIHQVQKGFFWCGYQGLLIGRSRASQHGHTVTAQQLRFDVPELKNTQRRF